MSVAIYLATCAVRPATHSGLTEGSPNAPLDRAKLPAGPIHAVGGVNGIPGRVTTCGLTVEPDWETRALDFVALLGGKWGQEACGDCVTATTAATAG